MLLGLLVAAPPVAVWMRSGPASPPLEDTPPATIQMPVEIIFPGQNPEWHHLEIPVTSIPEPATLPMALLTVLLLLRRKR